MLLLVADAMVGPSALHHNPPPHLHGRQGKIFFATQVGVEPPTIVLFCNHPARFEQTYRRYLLGVFRDQLSFGEVPIKLYLRKRDSHSGGRGDDDASDANRDAKGAQA